MGWHVGLTYEEMQEQFGDKSAAAQSKNQQQEPSTTTKSSSSTTSTPTATACPIQESSFVPPPPPSDYGSIYHLCRKQDWETCVESKQPYFPRTFLRDGKFTRASLYLEDLIDVANEYYAEVSPFSEDWIVLQLDPHFLYHGLGIPILAAVAPESSVDAEIKCLQIFGGLSTHPAVLKSLVRTVYPLKRRDVDGKFIGMLQNQPVCGCTGPKENDKKDDDDDDEEELLELTMVQETPSKDAGTKTKKKKGFFSKFSSKKAPVSKD